MAYVDSFRDLEVYKLSRELASTIFEITKRFPNEEKFSLTDQVRRSSRSIGAQIAEAWAKRRYVKHFISKLTDADGEQQETQHWIEVALDCEYINKDEAEQLISEYQKLGRMIGAMINKASTFCK
ncbi:four helix bundle protein [Rhodohalobacter sulfatireducens]|uniref:Four helix bundle protein n=1 Tax=Rhodohalobacter sulfatireducens TaxID=2911366 RepID=A0ABS9K8V6_9BACT|nr:four helix bundle protein [Rhodohalobacter sulfatireducens]MCG2587276.1 four helix bundle protein [Rhodohalobacter sulfatireducens]